MKKWGEADVLSVDICESLYVCHGVGVLFVVHGVKIRNLFRYASFFEKYFKF